MIRSGIEHAALRVGDRALATAFLTIGALLLYVALIDQGPWLELLVGAGAGHASVLHELLHDGRHLQGAPCH